MLFRTIKRLIELKRTEGLSEKLDVFFAAGRLTLEEFNALTDLLEALET